MVARSRRQATRAGPGPASWLVSGSAARPLSEWLSVGCVACVGAETKASFGRPMETPMATSDDELTSALAESDEQHRREIEHLKAQYEAMLVHVRSSFSYRLGDTILDLASRPGRRRFPRRFWALVKEVRSRRRGGPGAASTASLLPEVPPRRPTSVVSILDEFSHACLRQRSSSHLRRPALSTPSMEPICFLETAWNGNGGQWVYAFSNFGKSEALPELGRGGPVRGHERAVEQGGPGVIRPVPAGSPGVRPCRDDRCRVCAAVSVRTRARPSSHDDVRGPACDPQPHRPAIRTGREFVLRRCVAGPQVPRARA